MLQKAFQVIGKINKAENNPTVHFSKKNRRNGING